MKNKKNLIIVSMMVIVAVMAIGYSYFATRLNINATGNITSEWNVYFSNIRVGTITGSASNKVTPSVSGTTANMEANLQLPGDSITYELTLTNAGTIGAIIEDIEAKSEGSTGIVYSISGLKIGDKLAGGANKVITIKIEYDSSVTSQPSETSKTLTVNIDAVQDIGQSITTDTPIIEGEYGTFARTILNSSSIQSSANIVFTNGPGTVTSYTSVKSKITDMYDFYPYNGKSYYYGTSYEFNKSTGKYTISGSTISGKLEDMDDFSKYRYSCQSESVSSSCDILYEITEKLDQYWAMAYTYNGKENYTQNNGKGLYSAIDDNGATYYFRGEVENNYVQFGTYEKDTTINVYQYDTDASDDYIPLNIKAGTPMYWRIVRVNGDGTIRLVYDGITLAKNGEEHSAVVNFGNYGGDEVKHIGYTYDNNGIESDSYIKQMIDSWYENNLKNSYGSYIADSIFCNNRSIESQTDDNIDYTNSRIYDGNPSLTCEINDRYTMKIENGNGLLKNPVGLLTIDEVMLAGGTTNRSNEKFYLYSGEPFWTMTPYWYSPSEGAPYLWAVSDVYPQYADYKLTQKGGPWEGSGVRPVINLKSDVSFTGNGTIDNPYVVQTN